MARPSAVVGIGQTDYRRQLDVTLDGLVRWAALEALEDAGMTFADIDAIVIGKAPDALEAVMMPELSLADALGAVGKPIHRVHTAG
ncbi:MAG TPA: thiolase domain-containing protein, partial [Acidimicrobiia bacterium]|nr:thiolase domain-containing protein [Acidimicrobiia bacterium]